MPCRSQRAGESDSDGTLRRRGCTARRRVRNHGSPQTAGGLGSAAGRHGTLELTVPGLCKCTAHFRTSISCSDSDRRCAAPPGSACSGSGVLPKLPRSRRHCGRRKARPLHCLRHARSRRAGLGHLVGASITRQPGPSGGRRSSSAGPGTGRQPAAGPGPRPGRVHRAGTPRALPAAAQAARASQDPWPPKA